MTSTVYSYTDGQLNQRVLSYK